MFVEHQALRVQIIWSGKLLHLIARSHIALGLLLTEILIFKLFSSDSKKKNSWLLPVLYVELECL